MAEKKTKKATKKESPKKPSEKLIPAVGYLRKSTKGKKADGREKQERSIGQQKQEVAKLAKCLGYEIVKSFEDEGISGWKRGAGRPAYQQMLEQVEHLGAKAILCDQLDRFTRADYDDVHEDIRALKKAGVRWIITANNAKFDLHAGSRNDIGGMMFFVAAVWQANQSSRDTSRRVTLARRNKAIEGKRTGGPAPYALEDNGAGELKHGDRKKVRTVKWIFKQFATEGESMNAIADELNQKKTPSPRGRMWSSPTVRHILKQRAYVGDFAFGAEQGAGRFNMIDDSGEVVENETPGERKVREPIFTTKNAYKPMIDRPLFKRAQKRLAERASDRSIRNRSGNYPLTGVLVCDHCKRPLTGCRPNSGKYVVYRCETSSRNGKSACKKYQIRQDVILPFTMRLLGKEILEIATLLTQPPDDLLIAPKIRTEKRLQLEGERGDLNDKLDVGRKSLLLVEDARNRKMLDQDLGAVHDRLEEIDKLLAEESETEEYAREDLKALTDWWVEFSGTPDENGQAVSVPVSSEVNMKLALGLLQDPYSEESAILVDPLKVNASLKELGAKIELRWNTTKVKSRNRHTLSRGRFRLGQESGPIPKGVLESTGCRPWPLGFLCSRRARR